MLKTLIYFGALVSGVSKGHILANLILGKICVLLVKLFLKFTVVQSFHRVVPVVDSLSCNLFQQLILKQPCYSFYSIDFLVIISLIRLKVHDCNNFPFRVQSDILKDSLPCLNLEGQFY